VPAAIADWTARRLASGWSESRAICPSGAGSTAGVGRVCISGDWTLDARARHQEQREESKDEGGRRLDRKQEIVVETLADDGSNLDDPVRI